MTSSLYILGLLFFSVVCQGQIIDFPDTNLKSQLLAIPDLDANLDGEITQVEALAATSLMLTDAEISDLTGIQFFTNITMLNLSNNSISEFVFDFPQLQYLTLSDNPITTLDFSGCPQITNFSVQNIAITHFDGTMMPPGLSSLDLENCSALTTVNIDSHPTSFYFALPGCPNLFSITVTNCAAILGEPQALANDILNVTQINFANTGGLNGSFNGLFPNLISIDVTGVDMSSLAINAPNLTSISIGSEIGEVQLLAHSLTTLDISDTNLYTILVQNGPLEQLTVGYNPILTYAYVNNNYLLTNLDFSGCPNLQFVDVTENASLDFINLKNGGLESDISISDAYVCIDEEQEAQFEELAQLDPTINYSTYCTFFPGGNFNTITGTVRYDADDNSCSETDPFYPYIKLWISGEGPDRATFTDAAGQYEFYRHSGIYVVAPELENPDYFTVNPLNPTITLAGEEETVFQDFCISANGINPDIEVIVSPQGSTIPGFPATYQVTLRNKGNQVIESATVGCTYNDDQMDFASAQPTATEYGNGLIFWNYGNLMPFETRTYFCNMVIHAPTDELPVNSGDEVTVSGFAAYDADVAQNDNEFTLIQTAVNSFDPNDILCLEGEVQPTSAIGDYLHYRVRFENTGTAPAQNIVVRLPIDQQRFQLGSLQLVSASHPVRATVHDSIAEFMFQSINLDSGGHGNVLLKVRSAGNLEQGDSVINGAGIYFDYNFPILTNEAETVFSDLSTGVITADASIVMYPNPTVDSVHISAASNIEQTELFDSQGRLVEVVRFGNTKNAILATSHLANGTYIVRISSASGTSVQKLIKK